MAQTVTVNGALVIPGGAITGSYNYDIWSSVDDGDSWFVLASAVSFVPRYRSHTCSVNGVIYVLAGHNTGNGYQSIYLSDVWRSVNGGVTWQLVLTAGSFAGVYGASTGLGRSMVYLRWCLLLVSLLPLTTPIS